MKSFFLIKSKSGYRYLFNYQKKDFLLINKVLYDIIEKLDSLNLIAQTDLENHEIYSELIDSGGQEFLYQYAKYNLLKANGYFDEINPDERFKRVTKELIESNKRNAISLEITEQCNLSCRYCAYGELYSHYSKRTNSKLSFEKIKLIIDSYHNNQNNELLDISFYGGEPLMNFSVIRRTVEYVKSLKERESFYKFNMTTNGLLLNKYYDFLYENNFDLMISIDGSELDNIYRVFPNGNPSFNKVLTNIDLLKSKYPDYFKNNVVFGSVMHSGVELDRMKSFFRDKYGKETILSEVSRIGVRKGKEVEFNKIYKKMETATSESERLNWLLRKNSKYYFDDYVNLIYQNESTKIFPTGTCFPAAKGIFVTVSGNILPCESIAHKYAISHIYDAEFSFDYSNVTDTYNYYLEKALKKCKKCYYARICGKCIFTVFDDNDELNCSSFMGYQKFNKYLKENIEFMETNYSLNGLN